MYRNRTLRPPSVTTPQDLCQNPNLTYKAKDEDVGPLPWGEPDQDALF
jgi:hypothetical protein